MTDTPVFTREVARIDRAAEVAGNMTGHRARRLIDASDPAFTDPFLVMAEDWMPRGAFPRHPHRGIETVTYVIDGTVEHFDNAGHSRLLQAGDVQWMTAGRGVLHEENAPAGTTAHTLQIWINLRAADKMTEPRYQDLAGAEVPLRREPGVVARVFSGRSGEVSSRTMNHVPVTMLDVELAPGATLAHDLPGIENGFLYVLVGSVMVGERGDIVRAGELAWLARPDSDGPSAITLATKADPARVLILSGRPVREPVAFGGPFVMNTQTEIEQAFEDYHAGRF